MTTSTCELVAKVRRTQYRLLVIVLSCSILLAATGETYGQGDSGIACKIELQSTSGAAPQRLSGRKLGETAEAVHFYWPTTQQTLWIRKCDIARVLVTRPVVSCRVHLKTEQSLTLSKVRIDRVKLRGSWSVGNGDKVQTLQVSTADIAHLKTNFDGNNSWLGLTKTAEGLPEFKLGGAQGPALFLRLTELRGRALTVFSLLPGLHKLDVQLLLRDLRQQLKQSAEQAHTPQNDAEGRVNLAQQRLGFERRVEALMELLLLREKLRLNSRNQLYHFKTVNPAKLQGQALYLRLFALLQASKPVLFAHINESCSKLYLTEVRLSQLRLVSEELRAESFEQRQFAERKLAGLLGQLVVQGKSNKAWLQDKGDQLSTKPGISRDDLELNFRLDNAYRSLSLRNQGNEFLVAQFVTLELIYQCVKNQKLTKKQVKSLGLSQYAIELLCRRGLRNSLVENKKANTSSKTKSQSQ